MPAAPFLLPKKPLSLAKHSDLIFEGTVIHSDYENDIFLIKVDNILKGKAGKFVEVHVPEFHMCMKPYNLGTSRMFLINYDPEMKAIENSYLGIDILPEYVPHIKKYNRANSKTALEPKNLQNAYIDWQLRDHEYKKSDTTALIDLSDKLLKSCKIASEYKHQHFKKPHYTGKIRITYSEVETLTFDNQSLEITYFTIPYGIKYTPIPIPKRNPRRDRPDLVIRMENYKPSIKPFNNRFGEENEKKKEFGLPIIHSKQGVFYAKNCSTEIEQTFKDMMASYEML